MIPAIQVLDTNKIIPLWDPRIKYSKDDHYGEGYHFDGRRYSSTVEVVLDTKTKELSKGVIIDHYPSEENNKYKVGDNILRDVGSHELEGDVIEKIVYEEYTDDILKGKKLIKYNSKNFPLDVAQIESEGLYCLRTWKPFYQMRSGKVVKWDHELYKLKSEAK